MMWNVGRRLIENRLAGVSQWVARGWDRITACMALLTFNVLSLVSMYALDDPPGYIYSEQDPGIVWVHPDAEPWYVSSRILTFVQDPQYRLRKPEYALANFRGCQSYHLDSPEWRILEVINETSDAYVDISAYDVDMGDGYGVERIWWFTWPVDHHGFDGQGIASLLLQYERLDVVMGYVNDEWTVIATISRRDWERIILGSFPEYAGDMALIAVQQDYESGIYDVDAISQSEYWWQPIARTTRIACMGSAYVDGERLDPVPIESRMTALVGVEYAVDIAASFSHRFYNGPFRYSGLSVRVEAGPNAGLHTELLVVDGEASFLLRGSGTTGLDRIHITYTEPYSLATYDEVIEVDWVFPSPGSGSTHPAENAVNLCPLPTGQITPLTSRVENPQLSHIHTATDFLPAGGAAGCGSCGGSGGASSGMATDLRLDRIHRYADFTRPGSFGPGVFSNLDIQLMLWNHGEAGEIWDPSAAGPVPLTLIGLGHYNDAKRSAIQGLLLYAADGATLADADNAVTAVATQHDGSQWVFELVQAGLGGDADRQGRLVAIRDRVGNQLTIVYAFTAVTPDVSLGSRSRLLEMATATDQRGRQLSFNYGWSCGQPVVIRLTYPTGAVVQYHYDGDIAGVARIDYPDGTQSTFDLREDAASQCMVVDYQDAGAEGTHRTKSVFLTKTAFAQADGTQAPQSPNRVRRVVGPTGEPTYLNWLERDGAQLRIYVFEGGGIAGTGRMLRLDTTEGVTNATWIAATWSFATDPSTWSWEKIAEYATDARFRMGEQTDPLGKSTTYERQPSSGAIIGRIYRNASGVVVSRESTEYNDLRQPTRHQDANGLITRSTYDGQGNLLFRTEGIVFNPNDETEDISKAVTWEWRYRSDGQVSQEIDPLGRVTDYEYDVRGFRIAEVSPADDPLLPALRARREWHYDVAGRLDWSRDAAGHTTRFVYDDRNRVKEVRYGNDSAELYEYGSGSDANLLKRRTDRDGMVTTFGYDAAGREIARIEGAQVPALAITTTTTYLEGTDLPQTVIRAGQMTEYIYDTRKRVIETRRWVDGTRYLADSTVFDAADRVAYTQDAFGRRTYSVYDDLDRVTRIIREAVSGGVPPDADLATLRRVLGDNPPYVIEETGYDTGGRVLAITDAAGIATKLGYDRLGRMTDRWEAFGTAIEAHWQWSYDVVGNRETETDPLGRVTRFAYTGRNLLAMQTVADGTEDVATTRFTYTLTGQRATQTDANNHTAQWIYGNCCDWLEDVIDPAGYYTHYTYTPGGLTESVRDASLHVTRTGYDGLKRLSMATNGDNEITITQYDDNLLDLIGLSGDYATEFARITDRTGHRAVAMRNHLLETTVQVSDGLGRTVLVIDTERHVTQTVYDQVVIGSDGTILVETATVDPFHNVVRQRADGLGRVREVIDAQYQMTIIRSDANGNRRGITDPLGHGTSSAFDARNRRTGSTDASGNSSGMEYDLVGNVLRQLDGFGHETTFTYTARNQKKTETDRLGNTTAFSYDPAGNLLTISDAENEAKKATVTPEVYEAGKTRYTYTERNQLETERFPGETAARSYTYHPNGQLKTRTDQRGIVTTYTYDGANRLTDRSYSDGTADQFVLDDAGRITSATASRSGVVVARDYYPTGLIKSETTTWPAGISGTSTSATVDYAYDAANRATTLTLPDGRTLDRTFTARNELESLIIGGQAIATLGYDNAGRRTSALYGNGLNDTRGYTDNNLLKTTVVGPAAAPLLSLEYAYDANNRKTAETDHRDGSRSISMGYDDADRLTSWTTGGSPKLPASQTWDLSAVGDWTKTTVDGVVENREYTPVHEIKTRNGVGVGYDPAGNLIRTDSGQTFVWDAENRLLAADTAPNADGAKDRATYLTDAFGRRVAKSVYGSTSLTIHDGWQVVQEISGPTVLPASAAADDGSLANLATVPAGAILPTTYDAQGNPQYPTRINFQPATTPIPSGYLADKSKDFAVRSNGLSYGWVAADGTPSRSEPVIRRFMPLPQYDTFVPTGDPETWTWQIALPAGSYPVVLVLGDATNREHTFNVTVQGETFADPHPYDPAENTGYEAGRFVGVAKQATVGEDGLLTIQAAADALNGTLCWLEIGVEGSQLTEELRQKLADEVIHANARTGGSPFWDGGRSETKTFVWGPGIDELMGYQRTTAETGTMTYFVHGNQQWSVYAVTDTSGQVVERFQYTATGKRASDVAGANGRSLAGLTTGFTGRDHQEATGTIHFRNREWDPDYQFISRDPTGYADGYGLYRGYFVPASVDPFGLMSGGWSLSNLIGMVAHEVIGREFLSSFPARNAMANQSLSTIEKNKFGFSDTRNADRTGYRPDLALHKMLFGPDACEGLFIWEIKPDKPKYISAARGQILRSITAFNLDSAISTSTRGMPVRALPGFVWPESSRQISLLPDFNATISYRGLVNGVVLYRVLWTDPLNPAAGAQDITHLAGDEDFLTEVGPGVENAEAENNDTFYVAPSDIYRPNPATGQAGSTTPGSPGASTGSGIGGSFVTRPGAGTTPSGPNSSYRPGDGRPSNRPPSHHRPPPYPAYRQ